MKQLPIIEIYFESDNKELTTLRCRLKNALLRTNLPPCWQEYYPGSSNVPSYIQKFPSNVVLINHSLVWTATIQKAIPENDEIDELLKRIPAINAVVRWKKIIKTQASFLLAVFIAFFPKCPFCWAAYMSMFGFLGLNTIPYKSWLLPVFIVLFFANLFSLYFSRRQHGYKLLLISLSGALVIVLNRYYWNQPSLVYLGASLLLTASLWNSLSIRMRNSVYYLLRRITRMT